MKSMMKKHNNFICFISGKKMREIKSTPKEIAFKVGEVMSDRISEKEY